ncbi:MAG: hypothetical protein DMG17_17260 [Acidobacteria bacterium]|nr:MAG: hypothetical protein DMG17_17260 [Acidobacteriota bacterium]
MARKYSKSWKRKLEAWALALAVLGSAAGVRYASAQDRQPNSRDLEVLQVQPNFYMIAGAGGNIGVQLGPAGIVLVDTGSAGTSDKVLAAIKKISDKPIRYIIDTSADPDHVGGNSALSRAGLSIISGVVGNPAFGEDVLGNNGAASLLAHDNVLSRMNPGDSAEWPTKTYTSKFYKMSLNGEGIETFHQPAAHTDGDSFVLFRRSNVIVAGDLFDPTRFPVIDTGKGGSIHGVIDALNRLLELTIPPYPQPWLSERTFVIPGHGPVSDSHDLLEYRDMVVIVTDIIQDMINRGMTLEQVKAANPTRGYNARYGANTGPWTTEMFVTSVYKGLSAKGR